VAEDDAHADPGAYNHTYADHYANCHRHVDRHASAYPRAEYTHTYCHTDVHSPPTDRYAGTAVVGLGFRFGLRFAQETRTDPGAHPSSDTTTHASSDPSANPGADRPASYAAAYSSSYTTSADPATHTSTDPATADFRAYRCTHPGTTNPGAADFCPSRADCRTNPGRFVIEREFSKMEN
jgi:hypothetical protein